MPPGPDEVVVVTETLSAARVGSVRANELPPTASAMSAILIVLLIMGLLVWAREHPFQKLPSLMAMTGAMSDTGNTFRRGRPPGRRACRRLFHTIFLYFFNWPFPLSIIQKLAFLFRTVRHIRHEDGHSASVYFSSGGDHFRGLLPMRLASGRANQTAG
jgi:hypothetical protein